MPKDELSPTKIRNRCKKYLNPGWEYTRLYIAIEVFDNCKLSFKQIDEMLNGVAEYEIVGSGQGRRLHFISVIEPKRFKKLTPEEKIKKKEQREIKAREDKERKLREREERRKAKEEKPIRVQYTKCIRQLIETNYPHEYMTYGQMYEMYYGLPLNEMVADCFNELAAAIRRAAYFHVAKDINTLNHSNSVSVEKNYLLFDSNIKAQRPAGKWEQKKIKEVMGTFKQNPKQHYYSAPYYSSFKNVIESVIPNKTFLGVITKIEFTSHFLHQEIYTSNIIADAIYRKFDKHIVEQINYHFMNPANRKPCLEAYGEWRNKYIEPKLIEKGE